LTVSLPNHAAAGLPLIAAVFDPTRIIYVALAIAAGAIVVSPLTLAVLEANRPAPGDGRGADLILGAVGRSLRKPIVVAPIVGALCAISAIPLPDFVGQAFNLIGEAAGGVALFLTGQSYYYGSIASNRSHRVALIDGTPIDLHESAQKKYAGAQAGARRRIAAAAWQALETRGSAGAIADAAIAAGEVAGVSLDVVRDVLAYIYSRAVGRRHNA
jgi:hypothetical protein